MPRGRPRKNPLPVAPQKMGVEDRENIKRELQADRTLLNKTDDENSVSVSTGGDPEALASLRERVARKERALQADEELVAKGRQKDRLKHELDQLTAKIAPYMPTEREMWYKLGSQDSDNAIKKNVHFQKTYIHDLERIKVIRRMLESDDPNAGNLESMRRAG